MINSLRAFGYDFATAIADLIDNSIFAGARDIRIDYSWEDGAPWFRVVDDGKGMSESVLREAMRLGSQNPLKERDKKDLGRFGLGLKTAAFSQCKLLLVRSKTRPKNAVIRCWDLDHVEKTNKWELALKAPPETKKQLSVLDDMKHGTVVLCKNLDRLVSDVDDREAEGNFLAKFGYVAKYLEMVFHRYLSGRPKLRIKVGEHECHAWDPFLESNGFTQERSTESLDKNRVHVIPFVLPHVSNRTSEENSRGGGVDGWNAHQGFYVYRNKRMIIHGGYLDFDFKAEEHYKLCRIRVDLPNNLDHAWGIDVRKATASPPSHVRADLERIAKSTRAEACNIYRARTGSVGGKKTRTPKQDIWNRLRKGDKVIYKINQNNEAIQRLIKKYKAPKSLINQLFHLVENSVPHRSIVLDSSETEDCLVNLPPDIHSPPKDLVLLCEEMFRAKLKSIKDPLQAAKIVCSFFPAHVGYRSHLDAIISKKKS